MAVPPRRSSISPDSDEANELLAADPLALLIGFALDQQVTVPTAFAGPLKIKQRLGTLEVAAATRPTWRRHSARSRRCTASPARWRPACRPRAHVETSTAATRRGSGARPRLGRPAQANRGAPGFGEMKIKALGRAGKRFGVKAAEGLVPAHPTLGDVDSSEALDLPGEEAGLQGEDARRSSAETPSASHRLRHPRASRNGARRAARLRFSGRPPSFSAVVPGGGIEEGEKRRRNGLSAKSWRRQGSRRSSSAFAGGRRGVELGAGIARIAAETAFGRTLGSNAPPGWRYAVPRPRVCFLRWLGCRIEVAGDDHSQLPGGPATS